jgi:hypothetical protein
MLGVSMNPWIAASRMCSKVNSMLDCNPVGPARRRANLGLQLHHLRLLADSAHALDFVLAVSWRAGDVLAWSHAGFTQA